MTSNRPATFLWLALALASCSRAHESELGGDSSTHWLRRCVADAECGSLSCECGVCSKGCSASSECAALGASAVCLVGAASSCGGSATQICDAMCERDADCPDGMAVCTAGRCRAAPMNAGGDGGPSNAGFDASADGGGYPDASLTFLCPPQRATNAGECVDENPAFAWNGAACKEIVCSCAGEDCGSIYATREACEADHAAVCQPQTTTCGDQPWYECNEVCPARLVLRGGGIEGSARCPICRYELRLSPVTVLDVGGCASLGGQLSLDVRQGAGPRTVEYELTSRAWEEAFQLSLALEDADFSDLTTCAGDECTQDAGTAWISRQLRAAASPEHVAYPYGDPPPLLRTVDEFVEGLIDQVAGCKGPSLVRCRPAAGGSDGPPPTACGSEEPIVATTCECPVDIEGLAALNGTSCDRRCGSCSVPDTTCGARCTQACDPDAGPVWSTYCAE